MRYNPHFHILASIFSFTSNTIKFIDKNYSQPLPWYGNEFIGNQYWRFAICRDGALVSNLGSSVAPTAFTLLAIPALTSAPVVLAAKSGDGKTILADSDYFVTRLAGYQRNLVGTILGTHEALRRSAAANALMALGAAVAVVGSKLILVGAIGLVACVLYPAHSRGNIRVVGPSGDPHDPVRAWAVPRQLADYELSSVPGEDGASILVVASGRNAEVSESESLVVAEPRATVTYRGATTQVEAHLLDDDAKTEVWPRLVALWPAYDTYVEVSRRNIRVFRLAPV